MVCLNHIMSVNLPSWSCRVLSFGRSVVREVINKTWTLNTLLNQVLEDGYGGVTICSSSFVVFCIFGGECVIMFQ